MKPRFLPAGSRPFPIAILSILVVVAILPAGANGTPGERTTDLREEVERLSDSLQRSRTLYDAATERARSAGQERVALAAMVAADRTRLADLRRQVAVDARRAEAAGRSLVRARAVLARRIVDIYMAGSPRIADLLLASGDYGDLAARSYYLEAIGDSDRALARRVAELRQARLDSLRAARAGTREVASRVADLEARVLEAASIRAEAEASAARLASIESQRSRQIGQLEDRIETIETRRESAGQAAEPSFPGGPYSIPTYIVMCESGGNYSALNPSSGAGGAYQIIPSTWEAYGGTGLPHLAPKAEQDRIAALIWANDGPGAWVCA